MTDHHITSIIEKYRKIPNPSWLQKARYLAKISAMKRHYTEDLANCEGDFKNVLSIWQGRPRDMDLETKLQCEIHENFMGLQQMKQQWSEIAKTTTTRESFKIFCDAIRNSIRRRIQGKTKT